MGRLAYWWTNWICEQFGINKVLGINEPYSKLLRIDMFHVIKYHFVYIGEESEVEEIEPIFFFLEYS